MNRYNIMHNDKLIAKADYSRVKAVFDKALCPDCIFVDADLGLWLKSRSIHTHRPNSRRLYRRLTLNRSDHSENVTDAQKARSADRGTDRSRRL